MAIPELDEDALDMHDDDPHGERMGVGSGDNGDDVLDDHISGDVRRAGGLSSDEEDILEHVRTALERSSTLTHGLRVDGKLSRRGSSVIPLNTSAFMKGPSSTLPGFATLAKESRLAMYRDGTHNEEVVYPRNSPWATSLESLETGIPVGSSQAGLKSTGARRRISLQRRVSKSVPAEVADGPSSLSQRFSHFNSLDEGQRTETLDLWWRDQPYSKHQAERLYPKPQDPPQEVAYPPLGYYKPNADKCFSWNERYLELLCGPRGTFDEESGLFSRDVAAAQFVRDFCEEAVPIAVYALANIAHLPAYKVHCHGITIEVSSASPTAATLFDTDVRLANMLASREFRAREVAQAANVAGLVVPFTILVEAHGCKALAYPRLPFRFPTESQIDEFVGAKCSRAAAAREARRRGSSSGVGADGGSLSSDVPLPPVGDFCYGCPDAMRQFHSAFTFTTDDIEADGLVSKLCALTKSKSHWMGNAYEDSITIHSPGDLQVYRSSIDNRLYLQNLLHLQPSTVPVTIPIEEEDTEPLSEDAMHVARRRSSGVPTGVFVRSSPDNPQRVSPFTDVSNCNDYYVSLFRPEFIQLHMDKAVTFDSAHHLSVLGRAIDEGDRGAMLRKLFEFVIPQAASLYSRDIRLRGVGWREVEKGGLALFLHRFGVNMRFLPAFRAVLLKKRPAQLPPQYAPTKEAVQFVEIEMAARALKCHIRGCPSYEKGHGIATLEYAQRVKSVVVVEPHDFWEEVLFPLMQSKYPSLVSEKWSSQRLPWRRVVSRTLTMIGALVRSGLRRMRAAKEDELLAAAPISDGEDEGCEQGDPKPFLPADSGTIRIVFAPKVQIPKFPETQFADGQEVACCLRAQRFLRLVGRGGGTTEAANWTMTAQCIQFLTDHGMGECAEVQEVKGAGARRSKALLRLGGGGSGSPSPADDPLLSVSSVNTRKPDKGRERLEESLASKTKAAEAMVQAHQVRYRKHDDSVVTLDTSKVALQPFGVHLGQKVQLAIGMERGTFTTIVGVSEGKLFRLDEGVSTVGEMAGSSRDHLVVNYGLHPCDPHASPLGIDNSNATSSPTGARTKAAALAASGGSKLASSPVDNPPLVVGAVLITDRGLLVVEVADSVVEHHFAGIRAGDIVQMRPRVADMIPGDPLSTSGPRLNSPIASPPTAMPPGSVGRVCGMLPGSLFVLPLSSLGFPVALAPSQARQLQVLHHYEGPLEELDAEDTTKQPPAEDGLPLVRLGSGAEISLRNPFLDDPAAPYPVESGVLSDPFDGSPYSVGLKASIRVGYHYRQIIRFGRGPHQGNLAVIAGVTKGGLYCKMLGALNSACVLLGEVKETIDENHGPTVIGLFPFGLSLAGLGLSTSEDAVHETLTTEDGDQVTVSACAFAAFANWRSRAAHAQSAVHEFPPPPPLFSGAKISLCSGPRCGEVAVVRGLGDNSGESLWVHFEGDAHPSPLPAFSPGHFRLLAESTYTLPKCQPLLSDRSIADQPLLVPCLTFMGQVVAMDASVGACLPFGLFHGQLLSIPTRDVPSSDDAIQDAGATFTTQLEGDSTISLSGTQHPGTEMERFVVVGVYVSLLWVQREGNSYAVPLEGSHLFEVWVRSNSPSVVGMVAWPRWVDMFIDPPANGSTARLPNRPKLDRIEYYTSLVRPTAYDRYASVDDVKLFWDTSMRPIGLFIGGPHAAKAPFAIGTVLQRIRQTNFQASYDAGGTQGADPVSPKGRKRSIRGVALERMTNVGRRLMGRSSVAAGRLKQHSATLRHVPTAAVDTDNTDSIPRSISKVVVVGVLEKGSSVYVADAETISTSMSPEVYRLPQTSWGVSPVPSHDDSLGRGASSAARKLLKGTPVRYPEAPYLQQLGLIPPREDTVVGFTYCLRRVGGTIPLCAVPEAVIQRMEERHMRGTIFEMGGVLNLEAMTFFPDRTAPKEDAPMSACLEEDRYDLIEEPLHSLAVFVERCFHVRPLWGARVLETIASIAKDTISRVFGRQATLVERSSNNDDGAPNEVGYFSHELEYLHAGLAEVVPELLLLDAAEEAGRYSADDLNAYRRQYFQVVQKKYAFTTSDSSRRQLSGVHLRAAFAGSLLGLSEEVLLSRCAEEEALRVVMVLEGRISMNLCSAVVGEAEFELHSSAAMRALENEEAILRVGLVDDYELCIRRFASSTFSAKSNLSSRQPAETLMERRARYVRQEIIDSYSSHPLSFLSESSRRLSSSTNKAEAGQGRRSRGSLFQLDAIHSNQKASSTNVYRFARADATVVYLAESDPAFVWKRGDVVQYGVGDMANTTAIILGVVDGTLWRWERNSGPQGHYGHPFNGSNAEIVRNYKPSKIGSIDPRSPTIPGGNPVRLLTWDGELASFDTGYEACALTFGVSAGQRLQTTADTPSTFPYKGSVLVVIGVKDDCLWFAIDLCGAMPFPADIRKPVEHFRLQPLYHAPVQPPPIDPSKLCKLKATLSAVETTFLSAVGTPTVVCNTSRAALNAFSGGKLLHGWKVRIAGELLGGSTKVTRAVIIGVRHNKVWAMQDYDAIATELRATSSEIAEMSFPPVAGEDPFANVITLPLPTPPDQSNAQLFFTLPTGGLGLFKHDSDVFSIFGVSPGDVIDWGADGSRRRSVVVGMRGGQLWRVDADEVFARPFAGVLDRESLKSYRHTIVGSFSGVRKGLLPW